MCRVCCVRVAFVCVCVCVFVCVGWFDSVCVYTKRSIPHTQSMGVVCVCVCVVLCVLLVCVGGCLGRNGGVWEKGRFGAELPALLGRKGAVLGGCLGRNGGFWEKGAVWRGASHIFRPKTAAPRPTPDDFPLLARPVAATGKIGKLRPEKNPPFVLKF